MKAEALLLMEGLLLGLDLPASVGFIVWVLGFGPKSRGSVWLSVSEGFFIYLFIMGWAFSHWPLFSG